MVCQSYSPSVCNSKKQKCTFLYSFFASVFFCIGRAGKRMKMKERRKKYFDDSHLSLNCLLSAMSASRLYEKSKTFFFHSTICFILLADCAIFTTFHSSVLFYAHFISSFFVLLCTFFYSISFCCY